MSELFDNIPQARSWREIPQPVKPRTMSAEGRWRLAKAAMRGTGLAVAVVAFAWGAWTVTAVLQENPKKSAATANAVPVTNYVLNTDPDGVLDKGWLREALALPKNASLTDLGNLEQLRTRLLGYGQVSAANLTRRFPDTIVADIAERPPVARVMAQLGGVGPKALLVARDGVVFDGVGFDPAMLAELPLLDGVRLVRKSGSFLPIAGMETTANLLAKARNEAGHLYRTWKVVSLARLQADREIEVRTQSGTVLVFAADGDFFPQLFRLNAILDTLVERRLPLPSKVDLSLGRETPVTFDPLPAAAPADAAGERPAINREFTVFHNSQPKA